MEGANLIKCPETNFILSPRTSYSRARLLLPGYLSTAFRHKGKLLACFLSITVLGSLVAIVAPQKYESNAKILLKHERADPVINPGTEPLARREVAVSTEELNSEVELIQSEDLLRHLVINQGLARTVTSEQQQERNIAAAIEALRSRLKVELVPKTNILAITYSAHSPEQAVRLVDALVGQYLEKHVAVHDSNDLVFFDEQVAKCFDDLQKANASLAEFSRSKVGAVSPAEQRDALLHNKSEFNATLQQTRSAILEVQARIRMLEKETERTPERLTTQVRNTDNAQLLQDLKATLLRLQLQRTSLLTKFKPNYPLVQELEQQIAETQASIATAEGSPLRDQTTDVNPTRQWIDSELAKAQAELRELQSRADNFSGIVKTYDSQARAMNDQQLRYEELIRNAKSAEENYALYLRKREESRINKALDQRRILNLTVIQAATHPYLASRSRFSYLAAGLIFATIVTSGLLVVLENGNNTFRTPRELEHLFSVPVLATLPVHHGPSSSDEPDAVQRMS